MNGLLNALINYTQPQRDKYAGLLTDAVTGVPDRAKKLAQGLLNAPSQLAQLASPQSYTALQNEMLAPRQAQPGKWMDAGMELSGMAPLGGLMAHTVYHGSPHKFNKFDMSKIGTGEGAQAYGHGLYFAESPDVAKSYSGKLSSELKYNGKPMARESSRNSRDSAAWALYLADGDKAAAKASGLAKPELIDALDPSKLQPGGQMYKVDIPDEAIPRMLDWDKPLSEQAPEFQDLLRKADLMDESVWPHYTGQQLYEGEMNARGPWKQNGFADNAAAPPISELLKAQGIPGIRYLDGGSRGAGQGTSNFVLFDDQLARILERNGQPTGLLPWQEGEWLNLKSK